MQDVQALLLVEVAYNLTVSNQDAIRSLARAAAGATPHGPVAVAHIDAEAPLDPRSVRFERADLRYVSTFLAWHRAAPPGIRQFALSLSPRAFHFQPDACEQLSSDLKIMAQSVFGLCIMANTGEDSGLHLTFGHPDVSDWRPARIRRFHQIARHLATAWRIRNALTTAVTAPALATSSPPAARDALRRAVLARERARTERSSASGRELWPALVAGRWSLLDAFTAAGARYIVAYENPAEPPRSRSDSPNAATTAAL